MYFFFKITQFDLLIFIDGVSVEYNGSDFVWDEYLEETRSTAAPNEAFKHVSDNYKKKINLNVNDSLN